MNVTKTSLAFFQDLVPDVGTGIYDADSPTYTTLFNAVSSYADGFVNLTAKYIARDGSMSEQYCKDTGRPLGASDLTWSYASFLTTAARRAGIVPRSWANDTTISVPGTCQGISAVGSYSSATKISFPNNQTPIDKVPAPTTSLPPCATPTSVDVTFQVRARTKFGQTMKIVGNTEELGSWDKDKAVGLSASQYTDADPVWKGTVKLAAGQAMEYKYIVVNPDGSLTWERDPNRVYVVPRACRTAVSRSDTWRS